MSTARVYEEIVEFIAAGTSPSGIVWWRIGPNVLCEYCLIHEDDTFFGCEVDHIISQKHGGPTEPENLAYACLPCNVQA